jgi:hypothetical protein
LPSATTAFSDPVHQMRVDALEQAARPRLRDADQPHLVPERRRLGDVGGDDMADADDRHIIERGPRTKGHAGKDRQLMRRVDAVDVEAGVRLGKAAGLRLGQHLFEIKPL